MKRSDAKGRLLPSSQIMSGLGTTAGGRRVPPRLKRAQVTIPDPAPGQRPLTGRQAELLDYIKRYRESYGFSPAVREIQEYMGINSPNGVMCHLRAMRFKGWLTYYPNVSRSITLQAERSISVPVGLVDRVREFIENMQDD
jgi:hypothetical protein